MKYFSIIFSLLFCFSSWSEISIKLHDAKSGQQYNFAIKSPSPPKLKQFHKALLFSSSFANTKESQLDFLTQTTTIAGQEVQRLTPLYNGIVVEGADAIYSKGSQLDTFEYIHFKLPDGHFVLSGAESLERAMAIQTSSLIKNPFVEKIEGSFEPVYLMHFGELRPVYKTRLPTLSIFDLKDVYVDAETGEILKVEQSAFFDQALAQVFVYSPSPSRASSEDLKDVVLKNLVDVKDNGFLEGEYLQVRTCCKFYTCPKEGPCTDSNKRCALESHEGARQTRETVQLPTDSLGLDPLMTLPPTISVDTVRCTYLPFAKASLKANNGQAVGFFDKPLDEPGPASEIDRFSEIQVYFSMMSFFNYIRSLLEDQTWCLRASAMTCEKDGSPKLENGKPVNPYRVFVNQLIPDMKMGSSQSDPENFIVQILAGKGSREKPIVLNTFSRMGNAAFVPALSQLKSTTPRADEILSDLIKSWDHNVFFQGDRDFAYDGDVVFHEFMHAITTSLVNKLNSLGLDEWGIHSEPGSLNEGWSDYFAAAFTNDSNIGEYAAIRGGEGEASLRNIENQASCPDNIVGEIHNDSQVWSGALWAIRKKIKEAQGMPGAIEFDRAVLAALSKASVSEDFKTQSQKLIETIKARPSLGEAVAKMAEQVLESRGVKDCFRAYILSSVDDSNHLKTRTKKMMFIPSKNQIGLKNYAPSSSQLEIAIPAGAKKMTLSWKQFLGGTGALLGTESTPDSTANIIPLGVISSLDQPIVWKFKKAHSLPYRNDESISEESAKAVFDKGYWTASMSLDFERCEQKIIYLSLVSYDFKYILDNLQVSFEMDGTVDRSNCDFSLEASEPEEELEELGCSTTNPGLLGILSLFIFIIRVWRKARFERLRK